MANHKAWMELSIIEKVEMVGKITHLLQNQFPYYITMKLMIDEANENGLFSEVKINNSNEVKLSSYTGD